MFYFIKHIQYKIKFKYIMRSLKFEINIKYYIKHNVANNSAYYILFMSFFTTLPMSFISDYGICNC